MFATIDFYPQLVQLVLLIDHDVLEIEGTTIGSTYGTELGEVVGVVGVVEGNGLTEVEPLAPEEGFVLLTLVEG